MPKLDAHAVSAIVCAANPPDLVPGIGPYDVWGHDVGLQTDSERDHT